MHKSFSIFLLLFFIACSGPRTEETAEQKQLEQTTTYFLIRHAEKDRTNPDDEDPKLNEDGLKRAGTWASVFSEIELDAIYSSDFKRTQQTVKPTAEIKNIPIKSYDPHTVYDTDFFEMTEGKRVLVVGHSNTIPKLANFLLKEERYENIPDSSNGRLYIVTKNGESVSGLVLSLE